jgi:predicted alpha/beta-fold hydrolase
MSNQSYRAPAWLRGAHAQTIAGRLLRRTAGVRFRLERIDTPDGDFLDLEWADVEGAALAPNAPLVLKLHGLEGSAHSGYSVELARALARRGVRSVGLNFRSCGGEMNRTARFYHSGETGDLTTVLEHLHRQEPAVRLGALGFSLGGNVLIKYLGEAGERARLGAAVAVSVPYDLAASGRAMSRGAEQIYARFFLRSLREKARVKRKLLEGHCAVDRAIAARSFREFDDALTAPLHGFADAEAYYRESSSGRFLAGIRIPTLLVHALDDPIAPAETIPRDLIVANPLISTAFTERGGHVGFVSGTTPWNVRFWAEETGAEFLSIHLTGRRVDG